MVNGVKKWCQYEPFMRCDNLFVILNQAVPHNPLVSKSGVNFFSA